MSWLKRRRDTEEAARKLEEAEKLVDEIVDRATRLVRLQADAGVYLLMKKKKGGK